MGGIPLLNHQFGVTSAAEVVINCLDGIRQHLGLANTSPFWQVVKNFLEKPGTSMCGNCFQENELLFWM